MSKSKATPVGRASFPHLAKTNTYDKYALTILLPKDKPEVKEFAQWLKQAVHDEIVADHGEKNLASAMAEFSAFKDGDDVSAFKTYRQEYANHWVLTLSRNSEFGKPTCVNRNKQPIDPEEIYPGCDVVAYIDVYAYTYGPKKSASIGFQHVMKVRDNEAFASTGVHVDDAFADLEIPDEEESPDPAYQASAQGDSSTAKKAAPTTQKPKSNPFAGV